MEELISFLITFVVLAIPIFFLLARFTCFFRHDFQRCWCGEIACTKCATVEAKGKAGKH